MTATTQHTTSPTRLPAMAWLAIAIAALGGMLYGYDIGIIAGALVFMKSALSLGPVEMSWIVAAVLGGGSLATLIGGPVADAIGRKATLLIAGVVFALGVLVTAMAAGYIGALGGRLIQGIGVGLVTIVVPLYMVEVMPPAVRGRSVTLFQLCLTFGILAGYLVGYFFNASGDWRAMFATALVPAAAFVVLGLALPKSPRWLIKRGRRDEARAALARTHSPAEAETTFEELVAQTDSEGISARWSLLLAPGYRKAFFLALGIGILNQLTGINTLLQFNTVILDQSGLGGGADAVLGSVSVGLTNFVVTIIGLVLIDRVGRRPLLIVGTAGATVALAFMALVHLFTEASAFQGYATLCGLIGFVIFFAIGPGIVVWLAISEVLPLAIRAKGMAVALFANSLMSAILAAVFMSIVSVAGYAGAFALLAIAVFVYMLLAIFPLPETRGRKLEEIETHFLGESHG
ncbi:sugar porter family MFS transporter [Salinisphaera sp. Q1T1-3]|uniref:sugar porter family MFS transporter n=1 Tax=Salinisphaera sp. Q1T1-3 TaxID=2321229 RepID=UPI000E715321|nr:sugar porter family MFS transporter [Salinisphaera sp. Q1T1-3]RJS91852.1 MFS transporter [Salinisphaera sp. Q1T1-3]